jgi:hypothetical protein
MDVDEEQLRLMLEARGRRTSVASVADSVRLVTRNQQARRFTWSRALETVRMLASVFVLFVVTAAVVIVIVNIRRATEGGQAMPVGLFRSETPVGTGPGGMNICVAIRLTDDAYRTGSLTVWWWTRGSDGCRSSASGVVPAPARLASVPLSASLGLPDRVGYRVDLELQLVPSGSETVTFTLDAARPNPGSQAILAYRGVGTSGATFELAPVASISVDEPGTATPPTPRQP